MLFKELLELNKDRVIGIIMGIEILLFLLGTLGFFIDLRIGHEVDTYKLQSNHNFGLGLTEDIGGKEISEYTVQIGEFTQGCINNISIKSVKASEGDFTGMTLCNGQKITLQDWTLEVKDVFNEKNQAIITKTKLIFIPPLIIFLFFGTILIIAILINYFFGKKSENKTILRNTEDIGKNITKTEDNMLVKKRVTGKKLKKSNIN